MIQEKLKNLHHRKLQISIKQAISVLQYLYLPTTAKKSQPEESSSSVTDTEQFRQKLIEQKDVWNRFEDESQENSFE